MTYTTILVNLEAGRSNAHLLAAAKQVMARFQADVHASLADRDANWFDTMAAERDADIVVAGAYGHSRVREWALSGVTRTLLKHSVRSSLVSD